MPVEALPPGLTNDLLGERLHILVGIAVAQMAALAGAVAGVTVWLLPPVFGTIGHWTGFSPLFTAIVEVFPPIALLTYFSF